MRLNYLLVTILLSIACSAYAEGPLDDPTRDEALERIADLLETKYVIPEVGKGSAAEFRVKCRSGAYGSFEDPGLFAGQVSSDLQKMTGDRHINFRVVEPSDIGESTLSPLHHPLRYHRLGIRENQGFSKLEWLEGNIGYFKIIRFYNFADVRERVIGAIRFLSMADAIIIDIRENGGGSGDYLSNYFLEHPTELTGAYYREEDFLEECWTTDDPGTERLTDVPLFILTGKGTFSASESFAYDMQARKRAVIVGEPTGGGAHSVDLYKVGDLFEIYISTARAINPVTGGNWDGIGVIPDIAVPAATALDTAIVLAGKAAGEFAESKDSGLIAATEEMQSLIDKVENDFRSGRKAEAESALDSFLRLAGRQGLVNEFFMFVLSYNYFSKEDEEILYAILRKRIEMFPESTDSYRALANAYFRNDRKEQAIAAFETVLKSDPDDRNAARMLERLRGR